MDLDNRLVMLVIDDGPYWFGLRGVYVRGLALRIDRAESVAMGWYAIPP